MTSATREPSAIDVRSFEQIYKSGDIMLQNPAESCVIFVSVILVSAFLEWMLQRAGKIDNKFAKLMVETITQEITIVGVLALLLMIGTSVIPRDSLQERYVVLFTWANMCLFFMALFFVAMVVVQYFVGMLDLRRWRVFEEGRMDSEELEALSFRERLYKQSFDLYAVALKSRHKLTTTELPFFEFLQLMMRKHLVKFSDLSYRTWLSLTVVVIVNLLRAKLTPFLRNNETTTFSNAFMFVGCIGFGIMSVFLGYFVLLHRRLFLLVNDRLEPKVRTEDVQSLVPLGTAKRGIEFVQIIGMSTNWYATLFITGIAKDMSTLSSWRMSIVLAAFFTPIVVTLALIPWCIMTLTMMGALSAAAGSPETVERLVRRLRGDYQSDTDSESDGEAVEDTAAVEGNATAPVASDKGSEKERGSLRVPVREKAQSVRSGSDFAATTVLSRPLWLDDDEVWDGNVTATHVARGRADARFDHLYYENIDREELFDAIRRRQPTLLEGDPSNGSLGTGPIGSGSRGVPPAAAAADAAARAVHHVDSSRPSWLEDDEEWDADLGVKKS